MLVLTTCRIFLGLVFADSSTYIGPLSDDQCNSIENPELREQCRLPTKDPIPSLALMSCLSFVLTATAASIRIFGAERSNYWRESGSGLSTNAYFLAKDCAYLPNLLFFPLLIVALFYALIVPRATFLELYLVFLALQFVGSGIGYVVSAMVQPHAAQLTGVTIVIVMTMFGMICCDRTNNLGGAKPTLRQFDDMPYPLPWIPTLSFMRWALEGYYLSEVNRYDNIYNVNPGIGKKFCYDPNT